MNTYKKYLIEQKVTMKLETGLYGKIRVIKGYKNHDKLVVHKVKSQKAYMVTTGTKVDTDDMVEINGDYWFGTLKDLKRSLGI